MPVESVHFAGKAMDIAVPSRPLRVAGVAMAGFRGRVSDSADLPVVPYPAATVFLDFGDVVFIDEARGARVDGSWVLGLGPVGVRGGGREVDLLQVRLSPVVGYAVLGASPGADARVLTLEELWGRDVERIREQLRAARSWDERFALMETALGRRQEAGRAVDPEIGHAWRRIVAGGGRIRVERLAAEVGWSRKRLWSRFRSQLGTTPKRAAQLVRFDRAAHRLSRGHSAALVSADGGYADQSHLYREAAAFTGLTPTALAAAPWLTVDPVAWVAPAYVSRH
ncbi:helix-turn-helix domain-containing protein [Nocardia zapadnayensis]|uniref:AraC family transcriptional regulator n=1 Tax=Nocardia rhamnosiphila TaxID=426716 RepID=UPI00224533A5|nr:helix-turn-helix domain-containing protein [Nocardia zapadnayensis]MCX0273260.1 helix-turn-helix domain-containing protein [Nocardia zapadnayensis]